ncbi:MAG: Uncharacterized protein LiPW16_432 [Microgenomates group bacterium LiPW_16]|nr:MAG: Uncharacterized protein LiPW16_432 [Microgenomates group bacterium LiPW_16]
MRKILLLAFWFPATIITLSLTILLSYFLDNVKAGEILLSQQAKELVQKNQYEFYAALPQVLGTFTTAVQASDARPELIRQYLKRHQSPLLPYADLIVNLSDQYGLDFRLIVSIAQCESNLCKKMPPQSYNCWGFQNGATYFISWEQALNQVAKTLKEDYIDQGLITPEQIMPKYAPPSVEKGGPWAKCVAQFMEELQ